QEKVAAVGDSVITMAVLLVGEDHGAHMYATFMEKTAKNFGYGFVLKELPETATQDEGGYSFARTKEKKTDYVGFLSHRSRTH
ncbi:MAG: Bifunctional protein FolD, partial [Escherichia coli DORA_A_5_14_21]